ncbi:MAG: SDR family oxidoreductase [Bacteroidota bacterium]
MNARKTVIITGGSSGIGRALAHRFALEGFNVVITGRDSNRLSAVSTELDRIGAPNLCMQSDVSNEQDAIELVKETVDRFGSIDVLVNNAGITMRALFVDMDLDVIRKVMDINFWGTVYCTKHALPYLLKSKGSVVGVSSIAGKNGLPGRTGYSASKFAMEGFLQSLRTENLEKGLHVLVACPGFTESGIRNNALGPDGSRQMESPRDEKKMMTAEAVADHIFTAVRNRKRDLVLTTQGRLAVWIGRLFPSLSDKLVFNHMSAEPGSPF